MVIPPIRPQSPLPFSPGHSHAKKVSSATPSLELIYLEKILFAKKLLQKVEKRQKEGGWSCTKNQKVHNTKYRQF